MYAAYIIIIIFKSSKFFLSYNQQIPTIYSLQ